MTFSSKLGLTVATLAAFGAAAVPAFAASNTINLQFINDPSTEYVGTAAAPDAGTTFNYFLATPRAGMTLPDPGARLPIGDTLAGLKDSTGNGTGISLAVTGVTPNGDGNGGAVVVNTSANPVAPSNLFSDEAIVVRGDGNVQSTTLQFAGLNPADTYSLYLYSASGFNGAGDGAQFSVQNQTGNLGATQASTGILQPQVAGHDTFVLGANYVLFAGLSATPSGTLSYNFVPLSAGQPIGVNNALQLVDTSAAVPEASSSVGFGVLLALGGLAIVARKKSVKA